MKKNNVYCKVNSQSEIDEIIRVADENGVNIFSIANFDNAARVISISNCNEIDWNSDKRFIPKNYTELSYTDFLSNLKGVNENEIEIPQGYNVGTYDLSGVYITTKILFPENKEFVEVKDNKIILRDKQPKVKPLKDYILKFAKISFAKERISDDKFENIKTWVAEDFIEMCLNNLTKWQCLEILDLISKDLNGDSKENNIEIYWLINKQMFKIADIAYANSFTPRFKDYKTAQFVIANYSELLNKLK